MTDKDFIVKVCGVTTEEDLEVSLEAGANAIGFNFYPQSPRYLTVTRASQLAQAVSDPYIKVGVFVNPSEQELMEITSQVALDVLQLHGEHAPVYLASRFRVWRGNHAQRKREALEPDVEAWLLDTPTPKHGGSGQAFDWSLAVNFPGRTIIAGGLDGDNVATAIQIAKPWGVDACSRLEAGPGKKDKAKIKHFVENALAAFHSQDKEYSEIHS